MCVVCGSAYLELCSKRLNSNATQNGICKSHFGTIININSLSRQNGPVFNTKPAVYCSILRQRGGGGGGGGGVLCFREWPGEGSKAPGALPPIAAN